MGKKADPTQREMPVFGLYDGNVVFGQIVRVLSSQWWAERF